MERKGFLGQVGDSITSMFYRKSKAAAVPSPHLESPKRVPYGPFQFRVNLSEGVGYEVQASSNLKNWTTVSANRSVGGLLESTDSDAHKFSYRFYRVIAEAVVSDNVVGYATMVAPPGYSMIAQPLQAASTTVSAILAGLPDGVTLNKFDTNLFKLTENTVKGGHWTVPNETLRPGEGAILFNPTSDSLNINFAGDVMQGENIMHIPAGFSVRSSQLPIAGRLHRDLGFPIATGDVVHLFDRDKQNYVIYEYDPKRWEANPPVVGVGESFWIGKTSPGSWNQTFGID